MSPRPDLFEPEDLEHLLARAERDPEASAELDFLADVVAAAELERARLARRSAGDERAPHFLVPPWSLAAAASLLFLFALGLWWFGAQRRGDAQWLAARAAPPYVAAELRSPDEALAASFAHAMEPYQSVDWAAAVPALEGFLARHAGHAPAHFYLAAACEQLGELGQAEEHYLRAASAPDALLSEHARLRLALLWLARGEEARARAELALLRDGTGELARNARELLELLGKR